MLQDVNELIEQMALDELEHPGCLHTPFEGVPRSIREGDRMIAAMTSAKPPPKIEEVERVLAAYRELIRVEETKTAQLERWSEIMRAEGHATLGDAFNAHGVKLPERRRMSPASTPKMLIDYVVAGARETENAAGPEGFKLCDVTAAIKARFVADGLFDTDGQPTPAGLAMLGASDLGSAVVSGLYPN